jgi:hypothetical protein
MLSKMGMNMPGGGGAAGGKVNFGAMQSQLNRNMKQAQMRERLLKKVQDKQAAAAAAASAAASLQSGATTAVFQSGEKPAKTPRVPAAPASAPPTPSSSAPPTPSSSAPPRPSPAFSFTKEKND